MRPEELSPPVEEPGPPAEARLRSSASTTSARSRSPRTPAAEEEGWGDGNEVCGVATSDDANGGGSGAARSGVVRAMREWRAKQSVSAAVAAKAVAARAASSHVRRPAGASVRNTPRYLLLPVLDCFVIPVLVYIHGPWRMATTKPHKSDLNQRE